MSLNKKAPLMKEQYFMALEKAINEHGPKTMVLWRCGKFYEMYGLTKDAGLNHRFEHFPQYLECSTIINNMMVLHKDHFVDYKGGKYMYYTTGLPFTTIDRNCELLVNHGYTILIFEEGDVNTDWGMAEHYLPSDPKKKSHGCTDIISPGTNFNQFDNTLNKYIMCIWIEHVISRRKNVGEKYMVGLCAIDINTGAVFSDEYSFEKLKITNMYSTIGRFFYNYPSREIVVLFKCENTEILLQKCGIYSEKIHYINIGKEDCAPLYKNYRKQALNCTKQVYQYEVLKKHYSINEDELLYKKFPLSSMNYALSSFCFLIEFLNTHNKLLSEELYMPVVDQSSGHLKLETQALQQLNVLNTTKHRKMPSVWKIMDKARTAGGKRQMKYDLTHPIVDVGILNKNYDAIEYCLIHHDELDTLHREKMTNLSDIEKLLRSLCKGDVKLGKIKQLYSTMRMSDELINEAVIEKMTDLYGLIAIQSRKQTIMETNDEELPSVSAVLGETKKHIRDILSFYEKEVNVDVFMSASGNNFVPENYFNSSTYPEIKAAEESFRLWEARLNGFMEIWNAGINLNKPGKSACKLNHDANYTTLTCTTAQSNRYHSIPKSHESDEYKLDRIIRTKGSKKNTVCLDYKWCDGGKSENRMMVEYNRSLKEYKAVIKHGFEQLIGSLREMSKTLEGVNVFIRTLDCTITKAIVSKKNNFCKPVIVEDRCSYVDDPEASFVKARNVFHPIINILQMGERYVPNDVELGTNEQKGILLYGTNAVGKSSYIKSIGIMIIMAQSGMYVPAETCEYYPYEKLYTRITGDDDIYKGASTFAVEMSELITIENDADQKSLVLGDELCRGTDTISAVSIFASSLNELDRKRVSFIFATHLFKILEFDEIRDMKNMKIKHMSVIFNETTGTLEYNRKLKDGQCPQAYGIEVCKAMGRSPRLVNYATEIRLKYYPMQRSVLSYGTSNYNAKKIKGICENCGQNMSVDTHHLAKQSSADENGFIGNLHKNHKSNLMMVCKTCHDEFHAGADLDNQRVNRGGGQYDIKTWLKKR